MATLYAGTSLPFMDAAACCLLAAAAAVRARSMGAHASGAMVLGCLCGLIGPILRESFLHGAPGSSWIVTQLPGWALTGSAGGILALVIFARWQWRVFPVLDASSVALATSMATIMALPELGLVGALTLGLVNGLAPGLLRDMALGDTAMLVERDWYAAAAALGAVLAMAVFTFLFVFHINDWVAGHVDEVAVSVGVVVIVAIILWKHPSAS